MTTRRDFLTCCSLLAAGAALEPVKVFSAPLVRRVSPFGEFSLSTFARCLHTTFHIIAGGRSAVHLELVETQSTSAAKSLRTREPGAAEPGFSLLFRGGQEIPLTQNTYSLKHDALGQFSMFLVPVWRHHGSDQFYEAIFNSATGPMV